MSDYYQTLVDAQAALGEAVHLGQHVVAFLAEREIVERTPNPEGGYPRGPGALTVCASRALPPESGALTHLQVMTGRMIHSPSMATLNPSRAACPSCEAELEELDPDWSGVAHAWLSGDDDATLACPACGKSSPITGWIYPVNYGFGNLAFRFWNWPPLSWTFVEEVRRELNHRIILVSGRM